MDDLEEVATSRMEILAEKVIETTTSTVLEATTSTPVPSQVLHTTVTSTTSRIIFDIFVAIFGHVPWFILRTLSLTVTLTLDFWGLFNLMIMTIFTLLIVYRYRIFNSWSRLPEVTVAPRNAFDLKPPDATIEQENRYPDEFMNAFLSSIKVFGYLDRPVFHELSKNLKTRKLKPGQILFSEEMDSQDFYIVVEGKVSVYIKQAVNGSDEEELHLLNEVRNGGTVTSLFAILSILSEDLDLPVPLTPPSAKPESGISPLSADSRDAINQAPPTPHTNQHHELPIPHSEPSFSSSTSFDLKTPKTEFASYPNVEMARKANSSKEDNQLSVDSITSSTGSTTTSIKGEVTPHLVSSPISSPMATNLSSTNDFAPEEQGKRSPTPIDTKPRSVHPHLVAIASSNTTLAVIPADSFRNLSEKFPGAAAHMVQVILTRFQRMTFLTLQRYLGLSSELLAIEKKVNEVAGTGLPPDLFPSELIESTAWRLSHQFSDVNSPFDPIFEKPDFSEFGENFVIGGDLDKKLRDSTFDCIAQIIGLTTTKNAKERERQESNSHIGSSIERFYYSTKKSHYSASISTGTGSRHMPGILDDAHSISSSDFSVLETESEHEDESFPEIQILFYKQGKSLVKEGDRCAGLYFVLDGTLEVSTGKSDKQKGTVSEASNKKRLFRIQPGGLAGYLAGLTGNASFVSIEAKTDCLVGLMPKKILDKYMEKYPNVLLCLAKRLVNQLSPLVFHIDVALEWGQVNAGQVLCRQGEPSHSIFIVLTGRLRSIREHTAKVGAQSSLEIEGEFGQSESVGELEVLVDTPRSSTVHAIRDSEVAIMPKTLFNALALRHPEVMITISRTIALKTAQANKTRNSGMSNLNLRTVALLPVSGDVPILEFAENLHSALRDMGVSAGLLQTRSIMNHLGRHAFTKLGRLKLLSWLAECEEKYRIVLYVADGGVTAPWTQRCIRQADCVLTIGLQESNPAVGEHEQLLLSMKTTARKELVLLSADKSCSSGSTATWLKPRLWIHAHHHVQMSLGSSGLSLETQKAKRSNFANLGAHFQRIYDSQVLFHKGVVQKEKLAIFTGMRSDFSRLARRLLSKSIGLVLGGGGARGLSHVGVIRALEEAGIPVDMVGGTSIGSFVGGLYARENDHVSVYGRTKSLSTALASTWRTILDLTYPFTAMTTGNEFNRGIWGAFGDTQIEDCWLPYFAVTTNITFSREEIHQQGYIWRYVRASMSLSGYLPPICDNGSMLMDGGYLNNVPADAMRKLGAQVIIAVDVGGLYSTAPVTYGDSLSGWWLLFYRLNPFGKNYGNIPPLSEIQGRLAYASSVSKLEEITKLEGVHYIVPEVQKYGLMDFHRFAEIEKVGYDNMKAQIQKWSEDGTLFEQFGVKNLDNPARRRQSI